MGNLTAWAETDEQRDLAKAVPLLDLKTGLEVKLSCHCAEDEKPKPNKEDSPKIITLGLLVSGHMRIWLMEKTKDQPSLYDLTEHGHYLVWRSSAYHMHNWRALKDGTVMTTVRWREQ